MKDVGDSDNIFGEVGVYNDKNGIYIEGILDTQNIGDSIAFKDKLINYEININNKINNKKQINFKEFKSLIAQSYKINYSKIKDWIRKDKKNKNNRINFISNNKENRTYNKNNLNKKEEIIKPEGDFNDLIDDNQNSENSQEKSLIKVPSMNSLQNGKEENLGTNNINNNINNIIFLNINKNNVNQNKIDENIQKSNSKSDSYNNISNDKENENSKEAQNNNDTYLKINKNISSQNDNNDIENQINKDSSSEMPQNQNQISEINIANEAHEENVVNQPKLRQINLNKNKNKKICDLNKSKYFFLFFIIKGILKYKIFNLDLFDIHYIVLYIL